MTTANVQIEPLGRSAALVPAVLLTAGGVLIGLAPALGVVTTYDGSPLLSWPVGGWLMVVPGLIALLVASVRPVAGAAVAAGAGLLGLARLLQDLPVVTQPDAIARPELFVETTARAEPFGLASGGLILLLGDLLMLAAGIEAARALARTVSVTDRDTDDIGDGFDGADSEISGVGLTAAAVVPTRPRRNSFMVFTGFVGVVILLAGTLPTPYLGGYLDRRFIPVGGDLSSTLGTVLAAVTAAFAVLVATLLPRRLAVPLLVGTALVSVLPSVTAVAAVLGGAAVALSAAVWWAVAGAIVLVGAGLLTRVRSRGPDGTDSGTAPSSGRRLAAAGAGLLAAGLTGLAAILPNLLIDGRAEVAVGGTAAQNEVLPPAYLIAAALLLIGTVLTVIPETARAGRPVLVTAAAGPVVGLTSALAVLSVLTRNADYVDSLGVQAAPAHSWTAGPGLWCAIGGFLAAVVAAVLAAVDDRGDAGSLATAAEDESLASSRGRRGWIAAVGVVTAVVALQIPVFRTAAGAGPTLIGGYDVTTWGTWALLAAVVAALVVAALGRRTVVSVAYPVAAAAVCAVRIVVPRSVREDIGFRTGGGLVATWVLIFVLIIAAVLLGLLTRAVTEAPIDPVPTRPLVKGAATGSAGVRRPAGTATTGRAPVARKPHGGRGGSGRRR